MTLTPTSVLYTLTIFLRSCCHHIDAPCILVGQHRENDVPSAFRSLLAARYIHLDQAAVQTPQFHDSKPGPYITSLGNNLLLPSVMSAVHVPTGTLPEMWALISDRLPATYSTTAIVLSVGYLLYVIANKVLYYLSSPIRDLPGPKSVNWLTGSLPRTEWEPDSQKFQLDWAHQYGPVVKYYGWFNVSVNAI